MVATKLLLVFSVLIGLVAEECSLGDLGVADFADKVTVTNTSETADAFVALAFNHGQVTMYVESGKSRTAIALAATKYTAKVSDPNRDRYVTYRERLLFLRDRLLKMATYDAETPDDLPDAWTELTLVQSALDQLTRSDKVQSCTAKLVQDVAGQVTVRLAKTSEDDSLWVLDCS